MELYRELYKTDPEFLLAERICLELQNQGFKAYLAGGCVRDYLLKRKPHDFDVATDAYPDQVEKLFKKTISVGKDFGVIVVVDELQTKSNEQSTVTVEVATFRKDGAYVDGRRPTSVEFSQEQEDALRRDLTVNALFFDLQKNQVIDYVGGQSDLEKKLLRAVGPPEKRFREDHLRILRTLRFSCQLGFEIEDQTATACQKLAALIQTVSGERIQEELSKLLLGDFLEKGLKPLFESHVLGELISQKNLIWKPITAYFIGKTKSSEILEQRWFEFFLWISQMLPTDESMMASLDFFTELTGRWKFSRDLKTKTLKSLQWIFADQPVLNRSLGELLALSFEPEQERGMLGYGRLFLKENEKPIWNLFLQRKSNLGKTLPQPWVSSSDLLDQVQGPDLGKALRFCYYRQLEGSLGSKLELISAWRMQHGNS